MKLKKITNSARSAYLADLHRFDGLNLTPSTRVADLLSAIFYQGLASFYVGRTYTHDDVVNQSFTADRELFGVATNTAITPIANQFVNHYDIYLTNSVNDNFVIAGGKRNYFIVRAK
ncbi:hypothetical protein [Lactobacillus sp. Sy-1]|uniref:hypothetical protein n=1 Tax=Lactobacillus sp. Sy-1 TaxID=2109645 RepID=UPI001C5B4A85|nr:hypothetical protein [Lactobacillus sp. Sy-1]MBW1605874.1 hypothetical protein [Lactobacillus sp. Sy-1]